MPDGIDKLRQIQAWEGAGADVRHDRRDRRRGGDYDKVSALRATAATTAAICAECFEPLSPTASVTMVGQTCIDPDRYARMPICLRCWLVNIATRPSDVDAWRFSAHDARPASALRYAIRRIRCETCGRPMRVEWRFRRLLMAERCCCTECFRKLRLRRANDRRRVRHVEIACEACGKMFVPTKSTAKTCSNACRQRLFRQQRQAPVG
jgi:hypothetical protein